MIPAPAYAAELDRVTEGERGPCPGCGSGWQDNTHRAHTWGCPYLAAVRP